MTETTYKNSKFTTVNKMKQEFAPNIFHGTYLNKLGTSVLWILIRGVWNSGIVVLLLRRTLQYNNLSPLRHSK